LRNSSSIGTLEHFRNEAVLFRLQLNNTNQAEFKASKCRSMERIQYRGVLVGF